MPVVEVPSLGEVEFPDGTPNEEMETAIKRSLLERFSPTADKMVSDVQTAQKNNTSLKGTPGNEPLPPPKKRPSIFEQIASSPNDMFEAAMQAVNYPIEKAGQLAGFLTRKGAEQVLPEDKRPALPQKPSPSGFPFLPTMPKQGEMVTEATPITMSTPLPEILGGAANVATQIAAPAPMAKLVSQAAKVPQLAERQMGRALSKLPNVALARRTAAAEEAAGYSKLTAPDVPSAVLYERVSQANPMVDLKPLKPIVDRLVKEESLATPGLKLRDTEAVAGGLSKEFFTAPKAAKGETSVAGFAREFAPIVEAAAAKGEAPFQQVQLLMRRLNEKIGALKARGGEGLGDMLQLKKGFIQSLEKSSNTAVGPAFEDLKAANMAFRNEYAQEKVADIIASKTRALEGRAGEVAGADEALNITGKSALAKLDKALASDPWLAGSFRGDSLDMIRAGLKRIGDLPLFGAPAGVDAGSRNLLGKYLKGEAAGSVIGGLVGGAPGAYVGGKVGGFASVGAAEILSRALSTPKGLAMVEKMLAVSPTGLTGPQISALQTFVRGAQGAQQVGGTIPLKPRVAKKDEPQRLADLGLQ